MVEKKDTRARGFLGDKVAFEYKSQEFRIPDSVAEKGIDAIIGWANDAKGLIPIAALGTFLYKVISQKENDKNSPSFAISEQVQVSFDGTLFDRLVGLVSFGGSGRTGRGKVLDETLEIQTAGGRIKVPTNVIKSIIRSTNNSFLFTYLDETMVMGRPASDRIKILIDEGILTYKPKIIDLAFKKLRFLQGLPSGKDQQQFPGGDIAQLVSGFLGNKQGQ